MAGILLKSVSEINRKSISSIRRSFRYSVDIEPKIQNALTQGKPVVALESTIITHGMPFPDNIKTAQSVEKAVLSTGALPATIAIIKGRIRVGLRSEDFQYLTESPHVMKCSRRDLAFAVASRAYAGTTVSATMLIANAVGIRVFATGGIGGVHRNGHQSMDISADLTELGRTPVAVVSSGIKSILDVERTLEVLETQGVCVASYGEGVNEFPDFYTRKSGYRSPFYLKGPEDAASLILTMEQLNLQSGILIGVPIPAEHALDKNVLADIINVATIEANEKGIKGNHLTPYLLDAINRETQGKSLLANIALIKNNAIVAGQIACELSSMKLYGSEMNNPNEETVKNTFNTYKTPFIIGATMLDISLKQLNDEPPLAFNGATYHSKVCQSVGGVGHNLAKSICELHGPVKFVSVIGNDSIGKILLDIVPEEMKNSLIVSDKYSTATCSIIFDKTGESRISMANMDILHELDGELLMKYENELAQAPLIIMDANLSHETMLNLFQLAIKHRKVIFYEPTDAHKANQPFLDVPPALYQCIRIISPNLNELRVMERILKKGKIESKKERNTPKEKKPLTQSMLTMESSPDHENLLTLLKECENLINSIESHFDCIIVTLGCHGVVISVRCDMNFEMPLFDNTRRYRFELQQEKHNYSSITSHSRRFYPAPRIKNIINVSGAGDNFSAGFISGLLRSLTIDESVAWGFVAACKSLQTEEAVPHRFFHSNEERDITLRKAIESLTYQEL